MVKSKINIKNKKVLERLGFWFVILIFGFCALNFIGCASIKETFRGFLGNSIKILQEQRKDAVIKTFDYDYFTCYTKTMDILKKTGSYVYAQDIKKRLIAIYVSRDDTTPVGVFFEEVQKDKTQVEVSSPSKFAKELIAVRIFSELEK